MTGLEVRDVVVGADGYPEDYLANGARDAVVVRILESRRVSIVAGVVEYHESRIVAADGLPRTLEIQRIHVLRSRLTSHLARCQFVRVLNASQPIVVDTRVTGRLSNRSR
ncbi:hypothetical protein [Natrarchaeobius versutus]|uniref:hypothetical protein n=1 Tax=Natrarchaeobius versutus TaxID=1679078 RepID=UPI00351074CD